MSSAALCVKLGVLCVKNYFNAETAEMYAESRRETHLDRLGFDDAGRHPGGNDAQEFESRGAEESCKFLLGALLAARHHHHVQIEKLRKVRLVVLRHHAIDDYDFCVARHLVAAILQDRDSALVVPVVNNPLHDVSVAACGHCLEEVARPCFAAIRESSLLDFRTRTFDNLWSVQKNAF